jgi:DNA replication protein DnaC
MNQNLLHQLRQLKLNAMAQCLQLHQESPQQISSLLFEDRLALMVQREIDARENRRLQRLLLAAQLKYPQACIEDLDTRPTRGIERTRITTIALSQWAGTGLSIIITGATGCGKTWLACALGQYACRQGQSVRYLRMPRLTEELMIQRGAGTLHKWLALMAKIDILILDDWGLQQHLNDQDRAVLLEMIDDRAGQRGTIITSQLPVEHWHGWIGEASIADAMLDRLLQKTERIELMGDSLRKGTTRQAKPK